MTFSPILHKKKGRHCLTSRLNMLSKNDYLLPILLFWQTLMVPASQKEKLPTRTSLEAITLDSKWGKLFRLYLEFFLKITCFGDLPVWIPAYPIKLYFVVGWNLLFLPSVQSPWFQSIRLHQAQFNGLGRISGQTIFFWKNDQSRLY